MQSDMDEKHQDKVLNDIALRENEELEKIQSGLDGCNNLFYNKMKYATSKVSKSRILRLECP